MPIACATPGFLVPDDLESEFPRDGDHRGRVAAFPAPRLSQREPKPVYLIYRDPVMAAVVERAERIARSDASVLVQGESGTGKEIIARTIHQNSLRAGGPFIAVNCAAIPEQLLESELFGHERGAFSGALSQRIGKLEAAQNGIFCSTKSVRWTLACRPNCCEPCKSGKSTGSAAARRCG
jgi:DNA-binding NtrC family response regulator